MKLQKLIAIATVLLISGTGLATHASPGSGSMESRRAGAGGTRVAQATAPNAQKAEKRRQKVLQRIRALRAERLSEALALDRATQDKLFPILESYDARFASLIRESHGLRREMHALLKSGASDAATNAALDRVIERMVVHQRELWNLQEARFRDVRKVLTPRQAATLFVVLPKIDRAIHRQVRRVLHGKGAGKRGHGPGPTP